MTKSIRYNKQMYSGSKFRRVMCSVSIFFMVSFALFLPLQLNFSVGKFVFISTLNGTFAFHTNFKLKLNIISVTAACSKSTVSHKKCVFCYC